MCRGIGHKKPLEATAHKVLRGIFFFEKVKKIIILAMSHKRNERKIN